MAEEQNAPPRELINRVADIGRGFMGAQVLLTANRIGIFDT